MPDNRCTKLARRLLPLFAVVSLLVVLPGAWARADGAKPLFAWRPWLLLDSASDSALAVAFSLNGKTLACANAEGEVRVWDTATGTLRASFLGKGEASLALAFAKDGRSLWLADLDRVICWDLASKRELAGFRWYSSHTQTAVFSRGAVRVALGEVDGVVSVRDTATRKVLFCRQGHTDGITALAFAVGGDLLASGSADGTVRLWEVPGGKEKAVLRPKTPGLIRGLAFAPDGRTLAGVGGRDGVILWDVASGRTWTADPCQARSFHSVAFSPNGKLLAAGTRNGPVAVWTVEGKGPHVSCRGHAGLVHQVAFADDRTVASVCADGMVRVWEGGRRVSARADKIPAEQLHALVRDLHGDDEPVTLRAILALAAAPRQAVPLLRERLGPQTPPPPQRVAKLLADLDSPRFSVRDAAVRELDQAGPVIRPALRKALEGAVPLEVRRRLTLLLERLERLAESRSRHAFAMSSLVVLERVGDADARKLLADLAVGTGDELVTQEAQAALARLEKSAGAQKAAPE